MTTPNGVQESIFATLNIEEQKRNAVRSRATPQYAQRLGELHRLFPDLPAGVKIAAARGALTDEQVQAIAKRTAVVSANPYGMAPPAAAPVTPQEPKKDKSLWGKFTSGLKTASRWTTAAMNFPVEFVQGGVAQIFDKNDDVSGWFISTELGSMFANNQDSGSGFFIGGKAKQLQGERARRYRGSIDGHAFTIGRGLAHLMFDPDTKPYRMLSGLVDAGVAVGVPFDLGMGDALAAARVAEEAGRGGKAVAAIAEASRKVGAGAREIQATKLTANEIDAIRSAAGALPTGAVDYVQANRFFGSAFAQRVIERTAQTNDFLETWELWGKKIDPELAKQLADAKTTTDVQNVLLDQLGQADGLRNMNDIKGGRRFGMVSLRQRDKWLAEMDTVTGKTARFVERGKAFVPKRNVNLMQAESPREMIDALETIDRATRLFLTSPETRRELMNEAADLIVEKNPVRIKAFHDKMDNVFKESIIANGTSKDLAEKLFEYHRAWVDKVRRYAVDDAGDVSDSGLYHRVTTGKAPDNLQDAENVFMGPQTTADLLRNEYFIPDPRTVRRATNKLNWVWVKKDPNLDSLRLAGELRFPFATLAYIQEEIWRPIVTATVGNFTRNVVDSQVSLAMSDKAGTLGLLNHPYQWLMFSAKRKGLGDIMGRDIDDAVKAGLISDAQEAHRWATRVQVGSYHRGYTEPYRRTKRLGMHNQYERGVNADTYTVARAHGDELGKLNADWASRQLAAGKTVDDIFAIVKSGDEDAVKWFNQMRDLYAGGQPVLNKATRDTSWVSIDLSDDANLKHLLESFNDRVNRLTGQHQDLKYIVAQGRVPRQMLIEGKYIVGKASAGKEVEFSYLVKGKKRTTLGRIIDQDPNTGQWIIEPYAFRNGENTDQMADLLRSDEIFNDPNMPKQVIGEIRNPDTAEARRLKDSMDQAIDWFHKKLYENRSAEYERSPLFRNLYYEQVGKLAQSLDEASLKAIIADVEKAAVTAKVAPDNYLRPDVWRKLKELEADTTKLYGTITREELNAFAAGAAIDDMKKMLYDATDRRNVVDIMRVLSPFAQQQGEFLARMGRLAFTPTSVPGLRLPNLKNIRRAQLAVEGGTGFDPDGDGRGFFFVDPTTNQWSFSFPLSGELTKFFTGIEGTINAPVKGVALGLDYRPGLGPFASFAMSKALPDIPQTDWLRNLFLPYGAKTDIAQSLIPSWMLKLNDALHGSKGARFFATTYAETMQALASTGKYDLSDPGERQRMLNDARNKARIFVALRGLTQFTGPASGDYDMKVLTKEGDVYASLLADTLQQFRSEDYNTAALRFMETFGEDAFTYLSNKSKAIYGGLEASQEFGDFERSNKGFFSKYKDVAGFFGPIGTEFDFEVYTRQLRTGKRKKLTPEEMLLASERVIGQAYYNAIKNQMGDKITGDEREYLSQYRAALVKKYPGFGQVDYNPSETKLKIEQLFVAAKDIKDNPVAEALNYYEQVRAQAIAEANRRGFEGLSSTKVADLQEWLDSYAQALISKYPQFGRVYDRLLTREFGL